MSYPTYGNQIYSSIEGIKIGVGSFWSEIYSSILYEIIKKKNKPTIGELGSGYGLLAFFLLKKFDDFFYVCIDLPEILCLSSYYLIKCFPNKNNLLYGEKNINNWSVKENNLVFLPSYKIHALKDNSVDLFINKNSLGEMGKLSAQNYLKHIKRSTKYFFHINHDNYRDHISNNSVGLLASEYNLGGNFKQLYRYPDLGHFSPNGQYNYSNDIFCYLYEKENQ